MKKKPTERRADISQLLRLRVGQAGAQIPGDLRPGEVWLDEVALRNLRGFFKELDQLEEQWAEWCAENPQEAFDKAAGNIQKRKIMLYGSSEERDTLRTSRAEDKAKRARGRGRHAG